MNHSEIVSKLIGIGSEDIENNKRNLGKIKDYINKLKSICEIGNLENTIQVYISKHDGNICGLDSIVDWSDYILTQTWVDKLATKSMGGEYSP